MKNIKQSKLASYFLNPWERIYRKRIPDDLSKSYQKFPKIISYLRRSKAVTVLDIAMGHGRHSKRLMEEGFSVYGFDYSQSAIMYAKNNIVMNNHNLDESRFVFGDMFSKFPFKNSQFDSAIAIQAIYHGFKKDMSRSIEETSRVLKDGGLFVFTVSRDKNRSTVKKDRLFDRRNLVLKICSNTYLPISGREKGLVHFYPGKKEIRSMLSNYFDHVIIEEDKNNSYFLVRCNKKRKI